MGSGVWLPPLSGRGCCCSLSIRCLATHSIHDIGLLAHFKKMALDPSKIIEIIHSKVKGDYMIIARNYYIILKKRMVKKAE